MNIYLSGCSGQGKTTTADILGSELQMPVIDGLSRSNPHEMGTTEGQKWLSNMVVSKCLRAEDSIHCRTPIDVIAYSKVYGRGDLELDMKNCDQFADTNPVVFYFPYWLTPKDDGFRPTDVTLNREVDKAIRKMYRYYSEDIQVYKVLPATPHQRVHAIREVLMTL